MAAGDLGYAVLGVLFVAIGLITLLLTALRSAHRDATFFLFGAMSCIWGLRFLLYTQLVPMLLAGNPLALQSLSRGLAYFGATAVFGFAVAYLGRGWRLSLLALAILSLVFSTAAAVVLMLNPNRDLLLPGFNVLVLIGVVTIIANALRPATRRETRYRGLVAGISVSAVFFFLENLRALGVVPVPFDVEWVGVLILYLTLGRLIAVRMFTNEQRLAAISHELATARRIQASLLPKQAPQIDGITLAARYVPMTEVAGDIYDFVQLDDHRVAMLIADVSGHGIPAALIASMVKGAFRAQSGHMEQPERVLAGMNRIMAGQLDRKYVTASCACLDLEAGSLSYAGAGHPPLLIQRRDQDLCVSLQENGLILGQFADATYSSVEQPLAAGDRLVFYTDGVLEATNAAGKQFGDPALHKYLAEHTDLRTEDFADGLLTAVGQWVNPGQDGSLDDDLTLVVVDVERS